MKNFKITFKESGNKFSFQSNDWNDFSAKLFQQTPISYIEDIEDMEAVFNEGFENDFIKIEVDFENLYKVLNNAFQIKRKGTKHAKAFCYNIFERPVTHLDFFQLLAASDININSFELTKYMCYIKATDYVNNWKSEAKLVVSPSFAQIVVKGAEWLNITLDRAKFVNTFGWFADESLFTTDFGTLRHKEGYYK